MRVYRPGSCHSCSSDEEETITHEAINNGILSNDLDGNDNDIYGLGGIRFNAEAAEEVGRSKDVYIGFRTDGHSGSGFSEIDPLDGSTADKLTAIFKSFYDAGTTNVTFYLGAGIFQLRGSIEDDWRVLFGWKLFGTGRGKTVIYQIGHQTMWAIESSSPDDGSQEIRSLTFDLAYFRATPTERLTGYYAAFVLGGPDSIVNDVETLHPGCDWTECFCNWIIGGGAVRAIPHNSRITNSFIRNCGRGCSGFVILNDSAKADVHGITANAGTNLITADGTHGYTAGTPVIFQSQGTLPDPLVAGTEYYVIASGLTGTAFRVSATDGGSVVDLTDTGTGGPHYVHRNDFTFAKGTKVTGNFMEGAWDSYGDGVGGGSGGADGAEVSGNTFINLYASMYGDSYWNINDDIFANQMRGRIGFGLFQTAREVRGLKLHDNIIRADLGINLITYTPGALMDIEAYDNTIMPVDDGIYNYAIALDGVNGFVARNNTIDPSMTHNVMNSTNYSFSGNGKNGVLVIPDNTPAPVSLVNNGSVDQTIADNAIGTFGLDSAYDPADLLNGTTDQITAPSSGVMMVDFSCKFTDVATAGYVDFYLEVDGSNINVPYSKVMNPVEEVSYGLFGAGWPCVGGETFKLKIENRTGSPLTLGGSDARFTRARIQFMPG